MLAAEVLARSVRPIVGKISRAPHFALLSGRPKGLLSGLFFVGLLLGTQLSCSTRLSLGFLFFGD